MLMTAGCYEDKLTLMMTSAVLQETGMPTKDNDPLLSQLDTIAKGLSDTFSPFAK